VISPTQTPQPNNTQHSQEKENHAPAGFEPAIPTSGRLQTHDVDRAGTGLIFLYRTEIKMISYEILGRRLNAVKTFAHLVSCIASGGCFSRRLGINYRPLLEELSSPGKFRILK